MRGGNGKLRVSHWPNPVPPQPDSHAGTWSHDPDVKSLIVTVTHGASKKTTWEHT